MEQPRYRELRHTSAGSHTRSLRHSGSAAIKGTTYHEALSCYADEQGRTGVYLLNRLTVAQSGIVGVANDSDPARSPLKTTVAICRHPE